MKVKLKHPLDFKVAHISASEIEASRFLLSLAFSPLNYHIDDDPMDVEELVIKYGRRSIKKLRNLTRAAFIRLGSATETWKHYGAFIVMAGKMIDGDLIEVDA